jgi:hypothetical protein
LPPHGRRPRAADLDRHNAAARHHGKPWVIRHPAGLAKVFARRVTFRLAGSFMIRAIHAVVSLRSPPGHKVAAVAAEECPVEVRIEVIKGGIES